MNIDLPFIFGTADRLVIDRGGEHVGRGFSDHIVHIRRLNSPGIREVTTRDGRHRTSTAFPSTPPTPPTPTDPARDVGSKRI